MPRACSLRTAASGCFGFTEAVQQLNTACAGQICAAHAWRYRAAWRHAHARLNTREHSCERLARLGPALHEWVAGEARAGVHYAVLGDFNHDLLVASSAMSNHAPPGGLWAQLQRAGSSLAFNTALDQLFRACHIGQPHTGYIDYILLGNALKGCLIAGSQTKS